MYRINPLLRNVLITTDEVIFHAPTQHTLDPRTIQQAIIIAEERFIRPAVCFDLYEELITAKNKVVTTENIAELQAQVTGSMPAGSQPVTLKVGDIVNSREYLTTAQKTLWVQYLWKLTAECVMLTASSEAFIQFTSTGLVHSNPPANLMSGSGLTTPDLSSVKWLIDKKMMDRIDPLIQAMHEWICKHKNDYGSYCKACDCDSNGVAYKRKTDFIMGIYDEEENSCGCD